MPLVGVDLAFIVTQKLAVVWQVLAVGGFWGGLLCGYCVVVVSQL